MAGMVTEVQSEPEPKPERANPLFVTSPLPEYGGSRFSS